MKQIISFGQILLRLPMERKLIPQTTAYTSSNYFMPLAAEHMNAKVSPYLAMLTELQQEFPAMSRVIALTAVSGKVRRRTWIMMATTSKSQL